MEGDNKTDIKMTLYLANSRLPQPELQVREEKEISRWVCEVLLSQAYEV